MTMAIDRERTWEATATHEEIRAKHGKSSIRRRWRVEGTRVGNSRLLTKTMARATASNYGGIVVEVIPFIPLPERQAMGMPACPRCEAAASSPCKSSTGLVRVPHLVRWELEMISDAIKAAP